LRFEPVFFISLEKAILVKRLEPMVNDDENNVLITKEELKKFKQIAFKDYGVQLTDEQAFEQGVALLNLVNYLIKKRREKLKKKNLTVSF